MRRAALALVLLACAGCRATAWPDGAPVAKVNSRRFVVVSDLDPDVLAASLPELDRLGDGLPGGRRSLVLFADGDAFKAWREATRDDAARRGCGDGFSLEGDINLRVRTRESDDLGLVLFRGPRRGRAVAAVVGAVAHQLAHERMRRAPDDGDGPRPRWLCEGLAEVERLRAEAVLDGGLDDPYLPGESAVEGALASLRLGVLALVRVEVPTPVEAIGAPDEDDGEVGLLAVRLVWQESVPWAGQPDLDLAMAVLVEDGRRSRSGIETAQDLEGRSTDHARLLAAEALARLVLLHPSRAFCGAELPARRLVGRLLDRREVADVAALLLATRAAFEDMTWRPGPLGEPEGLAPDLDAVLRELRVSEKERRRWLTVLDMSPAPR